MPLFTKTMATDIQILNPVTCSNWDNLLGPNGNYSFFHTAAWARVLYDTYKYQPLYFCKLNGYSIDALLPIMEVNSILTGNRGVSLPFTDFCEPILGDVAEFEQFFRFVNQFGREKRWRFIQIRGGNFNQAQPHEQYYIHELKITPDVEKVFSGIRPTKQRNIKKAKNQQIEIHRFTDLQAFREYFDLHCKTRKRHGVPPQPFLFFERIHQHVMSEGMGNIFLASYKGRYIAGSVFLNFRKTAFYKFGASDHAFQHLRPNDLVMWEAIKWYSQNGYELVCFGRTAMNNEGLRRFKLDWGAEERVVHYYKYDLNRREFVNSRPASDGIHHLFLQLVPIPVLKLIGRVLYKHMG